MSVWHTGCFDAAYLSMLYNAHTVKLIVSQLRFESTCPFPSKSRSFWAIARARRPYSRPTLSRAQKLQITFMMTAACIEVRLRWPLRASSSQSRFASARKWYPRAPGSQYLKRFRNFVEQYWQSDVRHHPCSCIRSNNYTCTS